MHKMADIQVNLGIYLGAIGGGILRKESELKKFSPSIV